MARTEREIELATRIRDARRRQLEITRHAHQANAELYAKGQAASRADVLTAEMAMLEAEVALARAELELERD